jgi:preprotein translocase subunit SecA
MLTKVIGTRNEREIKRMGPLLARVAELEPPMQRRTDTELAGMTPRFRERIERGESLDDLLPEAFALVREMGWRVLRMRHFDVQLIGGIALHRGSISEMKTGEGKTLVATLPAYLNALAGKGVHVVTVNDYLARRDSEWMGQLYQALGLSVGVIQHSLGDAERKAAYGADITYGTNNEFGFDYLRDNMKFDLTGYVQRGHNFAIVDEVDSILVDEARTPLIISGPAEESTDKYYRIDTIVPKLKPGARISGDKKAEERAELELTGDYIVDEKAKTVSLTEQGMAHAEQLLGVKNLWDPSNIDALHHVNQALRAHTLFEKDVEYVVKDGQVIIVDEFTGRLMPGRRWSDGLHQAVEAKEKVKIERENQTLATVTFQNYFRMYDKLGGMTGTAETEAAEFDKIYKLDVLVIPTNRPLIRVEHPDVVYRTEREKFDAVVAEIQELHEVGRPVLVGTISIEKSEALSKLLKKAGVKHVVLNAKYHEREAEIVAQAGRFGAVTIATNMAGRGTDIILGGLPDLRVKALLAEAEVELAEATPEQHADAERQAREEMTRDYRKALSERKPTREQRRELALRYVGLVGAFAPEHPSVIALRELAASQHRLAAYLDAADALPRKVKERIPRDFYPEYEREVDFLGKHPLRAQLDALGDELAAVEAFLDDHERERVVALGGLHILATERHEARRIDNQLRGRAGRQGDPGSSRFFMSLQDDLMRIFGTDRVSGLMQKLGMEEGVPIEHKIVTRSIERAQKQVESQNFSVRKHLLEYDDVMNKQREAIYGLRRRILEGKDTREHILDLSREILEWFVESYCEVRQEPEEWNLEGLRLAVKEVFGLEVSLEELKALGRDELRQDLAGRARAAFEAKEQEIGPELMFSYARLIMLQIVDSQWKDHLYAVDHLKEGISLRGYGQRDPLVEYKKESYELFRGLTNRIDEEILRWVHLYRPVQTTRDADAGGLGVAARARRRGPSRGPSGAAAVAEREPAMVGAAGLPAPRRAQGLVFNDPSDAPSAFAKAERPEAKGGHGAAVQTIRREGRKVGRNDPCPCGSGKKYKKCHGAS